MDTQYKAIPFGQLDKIRWSWPAERIEFSPDGHKVLSYKSSSDIISVWDLYSEGRLICEFKVPGQGIVYATFSPFRDRVILINRKGEIYNWNLLDESYLKVFEIVGFLEYEFDWTKKSFHLSPDGKNLFIKKVKKERDFSYLGLQSFEVIDLQKKKYVGHYEIPFFSSDRFAKNCYLLKDGTLFCCTEDSMTSTRVIEIDLGKKEFVSYYPTKQFTTAMVGGYDEIALSDYGHYIAFAQYGERDYESRTPLGGTASVWDVNSKEKIQIIEFGSNPNPFFSSNGHYFSDGSDIWRVKTKEKFVAKGSDGVCAGISPDERYAFMFGWVTPRNFGAYLIDLDSV